MGDSLGRLASFFLSAVVFFIVPITIIALKQDDMKQTMVNDAVVEFVDESRAAGQITYNNYVKMYKTIGAAQEKCEIEINYKSAFEYPVFGPGNVVAGYERHYKAYNKTDILNAMQIIDPAHPANNKWEPFELKEGGYLNVSVKSTTPTLGTKMFRLFVPQYGGREIATSYGGYVGNVKQ